MLSSAKKIVFLYLILGLSWIYFSDKALNYLFKNEALTETYWGSTLKGVFFIIITAILLHQLIKKYFRGLTKSEKDYRSMFDANPNPMWIYDLKTLKFIEVNQSAIQNYGYSRQEFLSKTVLEIRPDDEKQRLLNNIDTKFTNPNQEPWTHILKNGNHIKVHVHTHEISYNGKPASLVMAVDITEQLHIKEQLKKQQEKLRAQNIKLLKSLETIELHKNKLFNTQKIAKIAGWEFNFQTDVLEPSSGFLELLNIDNNGTSCLEVLKHSILKEDKRKFENFLNSFKVGITLNETIIRFKKEKHLRYILFAATLKDPKKQKFTIEGYIKDVTEITSKDQLIHQTLERFEQLALSANDALYEWDVKKSMIKLIGNIDSIMGYGVKEAIHPEKWWVDRMHPEDFILNDALLKEAVQQKQHKLKRRYRFKTLNGTYKLIYDQSILKYDAQHKLEKLIGSIQDIEEITIVNQKNKRLEEVVSKVKSPIVIADKEGKIEWVNAAFIDLTDLPEDQIMGKKLWEVMNYANESQAAVDKINGALASKEFFNVEIANYTKSGEKYWLQIDGGPIYDEHNQHVGFIAIESEITERKLKEAKIQKQNDLLKKTAWFNAHQVRKPLASILGIIELMNHNESQTDNDILLPLLEKCGEELDVAITNAIHLTELKEDELLN